MALALIGDIPLSGGTINSPQLLLLSGVGPANHLRELDIPVVAHIPGVGSNLHDHPYVLMSYSTKSSLSDFGNEPEGSAFVKTRPDLSGPDIQMVFIPCLFPPGAPGKGYAIVVIPTRPQSRGYLTLRSKDPKQYPVIRANYLAAQNDVETFAQGVELVRNLSRTQALAPLTEAERGLSAQAQSNQEIREFIHNTIDTMCHPVGTCKMGHDEMAVVDDQLRVHGIEGLRVIDASIMPDITSGNTNAPVIMIAEKMADQLAQS